MKQIFILILMFPASLFAEQTVINNYEDARKNYFYNKLYVGNVGESLYCGISRPIPDSPGSGRSLEHVMPAIWMANHFGCPTRDCDHPVYKHAEGDLHNLWLAVSSINSSRKNNLYGEVDGERRFDYCPEF